jgi:hypothetical protein
MKKHFLVEFEYDERTRWIYDDEETRCALSHLASSAAHFNTTGPRPAITVTLQTPTPAGLDACHEKTKET